MVSCTASSPKLAFRCGDTPDFDISWPYCTQVCVAKTVKGHESVQIGKGTIDFKSILKSGTAKGLKYYIIEQEAFTGTNPLESAAADAKYMKGFSM